jgi:hypothetical protein
MSSNSQVSDDAPAASSIIIGGSQTPIESDEDISLNYQPTILKCKDGERLWLASNTRICSEMCKAQLKVISPVIATDYQ